MTRSTLRLSAVLLGLASTLLAQTSTPTPDQLKTWRAMREERVTLLREEIKQSDAHIEEGLNTIVETLTKISDSKDSRTKVARIKEDTGKKLAKSIAYYDQKRAALKEELRQPRLQLTADEKRKMIAAFDERIEKRIKQIMELNKSMPTHEDHERYKSTGGGYWGTDYQRNEDFEQNRRVTAKSNTLRDAIIKQLDGSIARLDRQKRTLKSQIPATTDPGQRKALTDEIAKTDAMIAERRAQKLDTLQPSSTATSSVGLKEAMDIDKALQTSVADLKRDFTMMFQRYNTYLIELSQLHATEAALGASASH